MRAPAVGRSVPLHSFRGVQELGFLVSFFRRFQQPQQVINFPDSTRVLPPVSRIPSAVEFFAGCANIVVSSLCNPKPGEAL
jgi:hypothetical protein